MLSKNQIQLMEQRSVPLYTEAEGVQMLPVNIDRKCWVKTDAERAELAISKSNFKCNGLKEWNERNRPGNNKMN